LRVRAETNLAILRYVLEQQRNPNGGNQHRERRATTQGTIRKALDQHTQYGTNYHREREREQAAADVVGGQMPLLDGVVADERADHEDIAVREVDEAEHAINHRVTEGD